MSVTIKMYFYTLVVTFYLFEGNVRTVKALLGKDKYIR